MSAIIDAVWNRSAPPLTHANKDLDQMMLLAQSRGLLPPREGLVFVPELEARAVAFQYRLVRSDYMRFIPLDDFDSFVLNAVRFCFTYGVLLAEVWYSERMSLDDLVMEVSESEITHAVGLLNWSEPFFETLMHDAATTFFNRLNWLRQFSLDDEVRGVLSAAQALGTGFLLRRVGIC